MKQLRLWHFYADWLSTYYNLNNSETYSLNFDSDTSTFSKGNLLIIKSKKRIFSFKEVICIATGHSLNGYITNLHIFCIWIST